MNASALHPLGLILAATTEPSPAWVYIAIPVVGALTGLFLLTHYAENTTARAQNRSRRQYRFKVNTHESGQPYTPPRAASSAKTPAPAKSGYASGSATGRALSEALDGAKQVLHPENAPGTTEPPPVKPAMPIRDPKRLAPSGKSVGAGKVEIAPNGFWIGAGTAPVGAIIVYRWHDGARRHEGRVTFAPESATGGHYVHTGAKPVQVTLVGFEAPR